MPGQTPSWTPGRLDLGTAQASAWFWLCFTVVYPDEPRPDLEMRIGLDAIGAMLATIQLADAGYFIPSLDNVIVAYPHQRRVCERMITAGSK